MDLLSTIHDSLDPGGLPVLSFPELLDRLGRSGTALTRSVVEHEMDLAHSGLRRVGEAIGPLAQLRDALGKARRVPRPRALPAPLGLETCLLVVGRTGVGRSVCDGLRVIGSRADLRSVTVRARWTRLVAEAGELVPAV